ncbi:LppA family lipoprotein [Mycoplasma mycoides subsp. capri]|uniref:LppA family lipoprotein n=1 Tax=Mycoplasma mycoides TaxID=2102 RepID=UPI00223ECDA9|nr:LppA family lipoprotein [Mycoplasma mycoides]UZK64281.1 LppA family lipoprotein [Mycoplasma mycoides subsp. capri]
MKKATKLLLSILPISSISFLSVISCSTTNSNAKQPDKKPEKLDENTPITPPKPDDKKPNNNDDNSNSNFNPNNKPDSTNPEENQPKKPDEQPQGDNPNNNIQPHNDQPVDQPESHKVDFSDLDKLPKEISFDNFEIYKKQDAKSAWFDLKTKIKWIFEKVINDKEIINKYEVSFVNENDLVFVDEKGVIDKVSIKFTKDNQSKTRTFSFTGFKKRTNQVNKNNKENYIKSKNKVDKKLLGLYPSLVAYMLMYSQDHNNYRELLQSGNVINFEELENGNNNLFYSDSINLNVEMKDLLLEYDKSLGELYNDKIISVRYDDINGILGLEVEITNRDDNPKTKDEPFSYKPKAFIFQGFRKIDFNNNDKNVLSINLLPSSLKEIVGKGNVKKKIDEFKENGQNENKISFERSTEPFFKQQLFKKLLVDINDNEHKIYRSTKTLSLHSSIRNSDGYTSIIGLAGNMSIYPFHSIITKDCINNISLVVKKEIDNNYLVSINFDFDIPVYSSTFSDLKSHVASDSKILKLKVSAKTSIK